MKKQAHRKTARFVAASLVVAATTTPAAAAGVDTYRPIEGVSSTIAASPTVATAGDQMPTGSGDFGCRPTTSQENAFTTWLRKLLTRLFR